MSRYTPYCFYIYRLKEYDFHLRVFYISNQSHACFAYQIFTLTFGMCLCMVTLRLSKPSFRAPQLDNLGYFRRPGYECFSSVYYRIAMLYRRE